jgi:hypothetical protein
MIDVALMHWGVTEVHFDHRFGARPETAGGGAMTAGY